MRRRDLFRYATAAGALGAVAGCAASSAEETPDNAATRWNKGRLAIGTGGTSGVFYQFGGALADIINVAFPGAVATAMPTGASFENIRRIASGDAALGLAGDGVPADAVAGAGDFLEDGQMPVVAIGSVFPSLLHLVVRNDVGPDPLTGAPRDVQDAASLAGLRVVVGGEGSGDDFFSRRVLKTAGLDLKNDLTVLNQPLTDSSKNITLDRESGDAVDALFASSGVPNTTIAALLEAGEHHLVPLGDLAGAMEQEYGGYRLGDIKGKEYKIEDVPTISTPNLLLVHSEMPEDLAYGITKAMFDYQAQIQELVPVAGQFTPGTATDTAPVVLHPGAQRYYDEVNAGG